MPKKQTNNKINSIETIIKEFDGLVLRGSSDELAYGRIPFNIPALDNLIGGGIPKKKITILAGQSNAGKTYVASQAVVSVQKSGGLVAWIDTEFSWDGNWMMQCGVDINNVAVCRPQNGEEAFDLMRKFMIGGVDLIVLDSIAGIVPSNFQEEGFDYNPMAWQARFVNQSIPRIMPSLKFGSAVVFINQMRAGIGAVSFVDSLPGGKGQVFFSHLILQVKRSGWITEKNIKIGFDIEVTNRKTKAGGDNQSKCLIPFKFDGGIDIIELFIREALNYDLITKRGPWYKVLDNEDSIMGLNGVKDYFIEHPAIFEEIKVQIGKQDEGMLFDKPSFDEDVENEDIL